MIMFDGNSLKCLLFAGLIISFNANIERAYSATTGKSQSSNKQTKAFISWQPWSDDLFIKAKSQKKLVLLDLHAVWCHWCHVMDNETYQNPAVISLIEKNFIPVSVDQDSRPDLSARYQDYGWPATVIYNSQGKERKILSGYYYPQEFLPILQDCIKYPDKIAPMASAARSEPTASLDSRSPSSLSENIWRELNKRYITFYDTKNGGWTEGDKFLPADNVEYSMVLAYAGDKQAQKRAKEVLDLQKKLLDPVWGGMYQYSTDNDWLHPHYEKIMSVQADNLRIYSLAYLLFGDKNYLQTAEKIYGYLSNFLLAPEGAFYTSQDADLIPGKHSQDYFALNDQGRRKLGIPRVDKHIYSRENGWAIEALTYFYMASGDKKCLNMAKQCANWLIYHRLRDDKQPVAFIHDKQSAQIYLADNLSMGKAFLALYAATGERIRLALAENIADVLRHEFAKPAGFKTVKSVNANGNVFDAGNVVDVDENIAAARFFNLLYHYSGKKDYKDSALMAMRYLSIPEIALKRDRLVCGFLLADQELSNDPFHVTVVGGYDDALARQLFAACQKYPLAYRETEWLDRKKGSLPGQDVDYPELDQSAAFICSQNTCSSPLYTVNAVEQSINISSLDN